MATIIVKYKGSRSPFVDHIYSTGLTWMPNENRELPAEIAHKFLHHSDVFEEFVQPPPPEEEEEDQREPVASDTDAQLAAAQAERDQLRDGEDARYILMDEIDRMDKQTLVNWASDNYRQKLDKRKGVRALRDTVKGFVDQYGMP